MARILNLLLVLSALLGAGGCAAIPQVAQQPQFHNPFPQLMRVAVLPFFNQSEEPTLNGDEVAMAYRDELQKIRGFEVMPVGTARQLAAASGIELQTAEDFQKLARFMGVDAIVVGSVTDFHEYYPPRMGLAVNWYAANPCFNPIPPGYGLPWGTTEEEYIPPALVREAEFALAREQLKTQTPELPPGLLDNELPEKPATPQAPGAPQPPAMPEAPKANVPQIRDPMAREAAYQAPETPPAALPPEGALPEIAPEVGPPAPVTGGAAAGALAESFPSNWPDPRGFIPPRPSPAKPVCKPHYGPIISQVRQYDGADGRFTEALEGYFFFRDDARFGGWQSYLQRKDDFYRFCCYLHITEMLAARGGVDETRVAYRWPYDRYLH